MVGTMGSQQTLESDESPRVITNYDDPCNTTLDSSI